MFPTQFDIWEEMIEKKIITLSTLSLIMTSILSLLESIIRYSAVPLKNTRKITITNLIFHVSDISRLFMICFKYDLIDIIQPVES